MRVHLVVVVVVVVVVVDVDVVVVVVLLCFVWLSACLMFFSSLPSICWQPACVSEAAPSFARFACSGNLWGCGSFLVNLGLEVFRKIWGWEYLVVLS